MSDFNTAIRAQEGKVTVAKDNLKLYESQRGVFEKQFEQDNPRYHEIKVKVREWRDEVNLAVRVLQTMREVAGRPADEPIVRTLVPKAMETSLPSFVTEAPVKPESPFPSGANGIDPAVQRPAWRHQAILWNIEHYPVPAAYRSKGAIFAQALRTLVRQHRDYPKWIAGGGAPMVFPGGGANRPDAIAAADYLKIDTWELAKQCDAYHAEISAYGVYGEDRKW